MIMYVDNVSAYLSIYLFACLFSDIARSSQRTRGPTRWLPRCSLKTPMGTESHTRSRPGTRRETLSLTVKKVGVHDLFMICLFPTCALVLIQIRNTELQILVLISVFTH